MFRKILKPLVRSLPSALRRSVTACDTLANKLGHLKSCTRNECVDPAGNPTPWYTYPAIEYLSTIDFSESTAFEYGCGNSTLFWSRIAKRVIAVEDCAEWHEKIKSRMPNNVSLRLSPDRDDYIRSVLDPSFAGPAPLDIIIVDGKHRFDCALAATGRLAQNGLLILDNSDWYPNTCELLRGHGFIQIDMMGFGPINEYTWSTSLFLRPDFRPRKHRRHASIGGITKDAPDDKRTVTNVQ